MKQRLSRLRIVALLGVFCMSFFTALRAEEIRTVHVANQQTYTDHVSLKSDSRDMDIMVKFTFDEPTNTLVVNLVSYRSLFMLHADVRYKDVIKCGKFYPHKLPYEVQTNAKMSYHVSNNFKKEIKGCRCQYVLKQGITTQGLQPQESTLHMLNDYLEYRYNVLNQDSVVVVQLGDMMVVEPSVKHRNRTNLIFYAPLNLRYNIYIDRDACYGMEQAITDAQTALQNIEQNYQSLKSSFNAGYVNGVTDSMLYSMKKAVVAQFERIQQPHKCSTLQQLNNQYNQYLDSLTALQVVDAAAVSHPLSMSREYILQLSRTIDNNVSSWLVATDAMQKTDIVAATHAMIAELNEALKGKVVVSKEQRDAIRIFRKAERYFKHICQ